MRPRRRLPRLPRRRRPPALEVLEDRLPISDAVVSAVAFGQLFAWETAAALTAPAVSLTSGRGSAPSTVREENGPAAALRTGLPLPPAEALIAASAAQVPTPPAEDPASPPTLFADLGAELAALFALDLGRPAGARPGAEAGSESSAAPSAAAFGAEGGSAAASSGKAGGADEAAGSPLPTNTAAALPSDQAGLEALAGPLAAATVSAPAPPPPPAAAIPPTTTRRPLLLRPAPPAPVVSRPGTRQPSTPSTGRSSGSLAAASCSGAVVSNTKLQVGINPEGHLITCASGTDKGLTYLTNSDVLAQGFLSEGWGVKDETSGATGWANRYLDGVNNLSVVSFTNTASTALSKVNVTQAGANKLEVTHDFHPLGQSQAANLYEINVTIKNLTAGTADLRYRRVLDWDGPANAEYVTVQTNGARCIQVTSNDGMATAKPEGGYKSGNVSPLIFGDFDTRGPADQGALFELNLGTLAAGAAKSFRLFYGATDTRSEAEKLLDDNGADAFSLFQVSATGDPLTYIFGIDCESLLPPDVAPAPSCGCGGPGDPVQTNANVGGNAAGGSTAGGVRAFDGLIQLTAPEFGSGGFGVPWGRTRSWSNGPGYAGRGTGGMGMVDTFLPHLVRGNGGNTIAVISNASTARFFDNVGGTWQARHFLPDKLSYGSGEYTLTDSTGNELHFYDFSSSVPAKQRGQLKSFRDPAATYSDPNDPLGHVLTTSYINGQLTQVTRISGTGASQVVETYSYTYLPAAPNESNTGRLQDVTLQRSVGGRTDTVRKVSYTYYDGALPNDDPSQGNGTAGDLMLADVKQVKIVNGLPVETILDTFYYRYYAPRALNGYQHGLKLEFSPLSTARLVAAYANPYSVTDAQAAIYADKQILYDAARRVSQLTLQGAGCSACAGGLGTFTYTYTPNPIDPGSNYNGWKMKAVETLPDQVPGTSLSQNVVYTNYAGEPMLQVYENGNPLNPMRWRTFYQYDTQGRLLLLAHPSAVSGHDEAYADLLHKVNNDYQYLNNTTGLIEQTDYYDATTATATTPGGVKGYVQQTKLLQGERDAAPALQRRLQYFARTDTATLATIYPVASATRYRNADGGGGQQTQYSYTWYGNSTRMQSVQMTYPTVPTAQNGPNSPDVETTAYDSYGRLTSRTDGDGYVTTYAYDPGTGAVTRMVVDATGLALVTQYEVDPLGRTTKVTEPAPEQRVTYTVYNDPYHEVRTYPGWDAATLRPTGPIRVERESRAQAAGEPVFFETLALSAVPTVDGNGVPTGQESPNDANQGHVLAVTRSTTNAAGQTVSTDRYFSLTGQDAWVEGAAYGSEGVNFYRTRFGYDERGRPSRVQLPTGTIQRTVYDGLGRVVSTWLGTNDTPPSGEWSPTNREAPLNMVQVTANVYDNGGIGDSNLTRRIQYPSGGTITSDQRVTDYFYDWRNRLVATKGGVLLVHGVPAPGSEAADTQRPIFYTE